MGWIIGTIVFAFGSALLPILNIEAYLAALAAKAAAPVLLLAVAATIGQMIGKVLYYLAGQNSLNWAWVQRRTQSARFQATLVRWRQRVEERPAAAGVVLFASAAAGLPPFAIMSVIAGSLRVPLPLFVSVGLAGRFVRFLAILGAVGWFFGR